MCILTTRRTNQYNTLQLGVYNKLVVLGYALVLAVIDYNNKNKLGEWCSLVLSQNNTNLCPLSRQKDTLPHKMYACFDYSPILLVTHTIHCRLRTINTNSPYPPLAACRTAQRGLIAHSSYLPSRKVKELLNNICTC